MTKPSKKETLEFARELFVAGFVEAMQEKDHGETLLEAANAFGVAVTRIAYHSLSGIHGELETLDFATTHNPLIAER